MTITHHSNLHHADTYDSRSPLTPAQFQDQFVHLAPLILEEWSQLEADTLAATEGDLDLVIDYVTSQTDRTRALIRRQLRELYLVVQEQQMQQEQRPREDKAAPSEQTTGLPTDLASLQEQVLPTVEKSLKLLEKRAEKLLAQVEREVLPEVSEKVSEKVKENPNTSLLTAFGVGLFIGLILGGSGRGR